MAQVAIEIIKQVLAPDNAPNINGVYAERRVSKAILQNLFQGLVEKGGHRVYSESGKPLSKVYKTKAEAQRRLNQIEMFKAMNKKGK